MTCGQSAIGKVNGRVDQNVGNNQCSCERDHKPDDGMEARSEHAISGRILPVDYDVEQVVHRRECALSK